MKKSKVLALVTVLTMMLVIPAAAHQVDMYEEGELVKSVVFKIGAKEYVVNDTERHPMDAAPFICNARTFVPVRFLGNALGVPNEQIEWDGTTRTATLTRGQYTIALTIGSKTALRNGVEYPMDVSPQITPPGRTQLPARFVAEGLGYNVTWCSERRIVIVYTGDTVPEVTKLPEAILPEAVPSVLEGDTIEVDGWMLPRGLQVPWYSVDGLDVTYSTDPNEFAFRMGIFLDSKTLKQDIVQAREILSQRFTDSQVDQIMNRLEYALVTRRDTHGLETKRFTFNNIRVNTGNMSNMGVFIRVWREGQQPLQ
ncbi:copper amine oxidase N-terminal domain-containing protein [Peptococcaceae bacterium]|nr:copper amine oxidase N-terminal domain-containing protein [Peptococcaceae bacterium]